MYKIICVSLYCLCYICSAAQDTLPKSKRLNIYLSYKVGLQNFKLDRIENHINYQLRRNIPTEVDADKVTFPTTIVNQVSLGASIFKNKKWFLNLDVFWGKNNIISKGYSTDKNGDNYIVTVKTNFKFIYSGYSIGREIPLNKWGTVAPFIGFYVNWKTYYYMNTDYQVNDKTTNEKLYWGKHPTDAGNPYRYGSPYILWLFDNPKLGVNYSVKLLNHTHISLSYSYWFGNAYANEVYGLSDDYIIKNINRRLTKNSPFHKDLYSHNISVGLTFKLLK